MKSVLRHAVTAALATAGVAIATQAAAQVTFFEQEGFQGQSFTTAKQIGNFEKFGFNDRASSVVVQKSRWEVCEDNRFNGNCIVLRPGRYPSLAAMGLNNRISSVKAVAPMRASTKTAMPPSRCPHRSRSTSGKVFRGRRSPRPSGSAIWSASASITAPPPLTSQATAGGLRRHRVSGRCVVLRPGRYASLSAMGLDNRVTSVRDVSGNARIEDNRYAPEPVAVRDGRDYRRRSKRAHV